MVPRLWFLKTPMTLHVKLSLDKDDSVMAEFPVLTGCVAYGRTIDEALLKLARVIQSSLEVAIHEHGA